MEGDGGDIFCKALDWKILFLQKTKTKQNIMQSSSTFIRMSERIPEVKKVCIDQ